MDNSVPGKRPKGDELTRAKLTEEKLKNLKSFPRREIEKMLTESDIIADTLHELRPSTDPSKHYFILKDEELWYHLPRKMLQRDHEITENEFRRMFEAGII